MHILYPELKPYRTNMVEVSDHHRLYVEESGNPEGIPVVVIHGGPGMGSRPWERRFFNPEHFRIILFDQRGAGRSEPHASLLENDTQHLLADLEVLRKFCQLEHWVVFGSSWGSTLSLLYAEAFPERVLGMILSGVFLCRPDDLNWIFDDGVNRVFPDYWEDFVDHIPEPERHSLVNAYRHRLNGSNELVKMGCAKAWSLWLAQCSTLRPHDELIQASIDPYRAMSQAIIGTHYFCHQGFLRNDQILQDVASLEGVPGIIVHGRYDMLAPLEGAQLLHQKWHDSELHIVRDAGHAACEPGLIDALVRATRTLSRRFADDYPGVC